MDVTMIGLQNAGKTSLLRVLAVRSEDDICGEMLMQHSPGRRVYHRVGQHDHPKRLGLTSDSQKFYSYGRLQYETSPERPCHSQMVGRSLVTIQPTVGMTIL